MTSVYLPLPANFLHGGEDAAPHTLYKAGSLLLF